MFSVATKHTKQKIEEAVLNNNPYKFVEIDNVFSEEMYRAIITNRIPTECLQTLQELKRVGRGYSNSRQVLLLEKKITILSENIRAFWEHFAKWMHTEVREALVLKFSVDEKEFETDLLYTRDTKNYTLGPHTDSPLKIMTSLFYIPQLPSNPLLGTSIYTPKVAGFKCPGGKHHDFQGFQLLKTVPYVPNKMFAFAKSDTSFHGVEPIDVEIERDLIIFDFQRKRYE